MSKCKLQGAKRMQIGASQLVPKHGKAVKMRASQNAAQNKMAAAGSHETQSSQNNDATTTMGMSVIPPTPNAH